MADKSQLNEMGEGGGGSLVSAEGVSHFLSEMSCGEVVAGSLPGRAFEFSSPWIFFVSTPLPVVPLALWVLRHWRATQDRASPSSRLLLCPYGNEYICVTGPQL